MRLGTFVVHCSFFLSSHLYAFPHAEVLSQVPLINQFYDYSCGAASLASVLNYYGEETDEAEVIKGAQTDSSFGTRLSKMAMVARKAGLKAEIREGMKISDLKAEINLGHPVIIEAQAWPDPQKKIDYPNEWDDGHYLVVIGVDAKNVYFMDPSLIGSRGFIPVSEFLDRWHDITFSGRRAYRRGLTFRGRPKPPSSWIRIP